MKRVIFGFISAAMVFSSFGCSKLLGNLRRDLDDEETAQGPTVGGAWAEGGMLDNDGYVNSAYSNLGHIDRDPASESGDADRGDGSWVSPEARERAARDRVRGEMTAYSANPDFAPSIKRKYKNGMRATREDFQDDGATDGSLWASDGQTNYYFTKNKVRGVGDIITITAEAPMLKDIAAELGRTLSARERDYEIEVAQQRLKNQAMGIKDPEDGKDAVASSQSSTDRAPAAAGAEGDKKEEKKDVEVRDATWADVDLTKAIDFKAGDSMMAEVIERYPNGNYKVRGTKRVRYRNGYRVLTVLGIAKGADIGEDDKIASGKLYEYRIQAQR